MDKTKLLLENWKKFLKEALAKTDQQTWSGGHILQMKISEDQFIHFTPELRAQQIIQSNKLLMNPPHKKFGIDAITAISVVWGKYVPRVQTTHTKDNSLVAILFKTNTIPQIGYREEVIWKEDVQFIEAQIISAKQAIKMLQQAPEGKSVTEDDNVTYV